MTELRTSLETRREEFDAHYALAEALENRMILEAGTPLGAVNISARHINTLKSGLIVHLYNIEEAIMTQIIQQLGIALGSVDPRRWSEYSFKEWLRESIVSRTTEGNEDGRLETVFASSSLLLASSSLGPQALKKPSGTWDDKVIATFARRMNARFDLPPEMWQRIAPSEAFGESSSPLQFLARRRNAIAHGVRSFEDGASDMSLARIRVLADITLDYMGYAVDAFTSHIENEAHLVPAA
ncbi:MAG TPA: MAE_28990/MAE_18760 family HEPN-like nuclease [Pseudorhizobium sp.]|jgi:hypothetical protein|nr:MAE_28990/MAE_18760 family HEPN-like nuclease [Pseudorhizobium sp.]